MTLEELIDTLESANMLRIFKGDEEMFQELQMKLYYTIYL